MPFDITLAPSSWGSVIVAPRGDIDIATAPRLRAELVAALTRQPPRAVICDLSRVEFIDAAGLSVLVHAGQHAEEGRRGFTLAGARGHVRRTLELAGLYLMTDSSCHPQGLRRAGRGCTATGGR